MAQMSAAQQAKRCARFQESQALPPLDTNNILSADGANSHPYRAYVLILHAEQVATEELDNIIRSQRRRPMAPKRLAMIKVINIRLMGWFMIFIGEHPTLHEKDALDHLSAEVLGAPNIIHRLGEWYFGVLLTSWLNKSNRTPPPASHPSSSERSHFYIMQDITYSTQAGSSANYRAARRQAMERDGLRCVVTTTYDEDISLPKYASLRPPSDLPFDIVQLEIAHVVPQAFFQQVDLNSINITRVRGSAFLAVIRIFGLEDSATSLLEINGAHRLSNLLTLTPNMHTRFDNMRIYFQSTGLPHQYFVKSFSDHDSVPSDPITFEDKCDQGRALPDPNLLAMHSVCAQVAHMSGAAGYDDLDAEHDGEDPPRVSAGDATTRVEAQQIVSIAAS